MSTWVFWEVTTTLYDSSPLAISSPMMAEYPATISTWKPLRSFTIPSKPVMV
jgi:hypothetical protein